MPSPYYKSYSLKFYDIRFNMVSSFNRIGFQLKLEYRFVMGSATLFECIAIFAMLLVRQCY